MLKLNVAHVLKTLTEPLCMSVVDTAQMHTVLAVNATFGTSSYSWKLSDVCLLFVRVLRIKGLNAGKFLCL